MATDPSEKRKAIANYIIGVSNFNLGKHKPAAEALSKTTGISPTQAPLAKYFLGSSYLALKQTDQAIKTLQSVMDIKVKEDQKEIISILRELRPVVAFTLIQCFKSKADAAQDKKS